MLPVSGCSVSLACSALPDSEGIETLWDPADLGSLPGACSALPDSEGIETDDIDGTDYFISNPAALSPIPRGLRLLLRPVAQPIDPAPLQRSPRFRGD